MANEVRQADVPGSHRADLAEMRAQTARADKAEAEAAALRGLLMDVKDYGVRCDCSCECTCGANDVEENIGHVLAAADAGGALVEELARLREAVYGPRDMTRNETAECMVKRLRDEREHYRANWLAEVQRANAAEKERDYYKDWVANWEQLYKERDAEIAQRDRRIAQLEAALRFVRNETCGLIESSTINRIDAALDPASPATAPPIVPQHTCILASGLQQTVPCPGCVVSNYSSARETTPKCAKCGDVGYYEFIPGNPEQCECGNLDSRTDDDK